MRSRPTPVVHRYGETALLVDLADLAEVRAVDDALRVAPPAGTIDVVPAARTVLIDLGTPIARAAAEQVVTAVVTAVVRHPAPPPTPESPTVPGIASAALVELPVRYDGPDLAEVAALTGLDVAEVVRRHLASRCTVAFGGFMPGFAYLIGLDPALHVPRRDTPRERVPAGAVAVAGEFTAVYPAVTPGGWRIIGTCDVPLFDVRRTPPALLVPGASVRFVRAGGA